MKTLTQYYFTYLIPKGIVFMALGDSRALKAPIGSIALYKQAFMVGLWFSVSLFLRELRLCLGLAPGQLMPNAWWIAIGCMVLWELTFKGKHPLTPNEFFHCYCPKEQKPGWFYFVSRDPTLTLVIGLPSSNSGWRTWYFLFVSGEVGRAPEGGLSNKVQQGMGVSHQPSK